MKKLFDLNREQLKALAEYKDVLDTGRFFERNFWQKEKEITGLRPNCQTITRYCFEWIEDIPVQRLPSYNLMQIKEILMKNHLSGMIQTVFRNNILAVLTNAYPEEFKRRELMEWMWSNHGTWKNDAYVIEAVQYMILKEGIRRVDMIPKYDWKKRLVSYGIYNVLSRFGWSIFKLFDFVYPGRFKPADFRYRTKWKASRLHDPYENAYYVMEKVFKDNNLSRDQILMLNCTGFRGLKLVSMLLTLFEGKPSRAKEFYFYHTCGNAENRKKLEIEIRQALIKKQDAAILRRLNDAASGKYIYNLHANYGVYSFIKRQATRRNLQIHELVEQFGFVYKTSKGDRSPLDPNQIWDMRKNGLTYVEIAEKLESNPSTISSLCKRHFGGDPLIPRPIEEYVTIQELMNTYHVDHKTIMKLVMDYHLENHMTIRHRYLRKSEIVPAILQYKAKSLQHQALLVRYG